jgi:hypothetical protein
VRAALACALAALALAPAAARAQWSVDVAAGRAVNDPLAARVTSTNASAGVHFDGRDGRAVYLYGGGPLGSEGPAWGAGGFAAWVGRDFGPVSLGVDLGGDGYGYGAAGIVPAGYGGAGRALPTLALRGGRLLVQLRSGAVGAYSQVGDSSEWRVMHDSRARLAVTAAPGLEVSADGRFLRAKERDYPYVGGGAELDRGPASAWAFAGKWLASVFPTPAVAYGAGASLRMRCGTELSLSFEQAPTDPVYFTAPRRTWSVQLSRAFGRRARAEAPAAAVHAALPVLPADEGGRVAITLPAATAEVAAADGASPPTVAGDFTGWKPVPMTRQGGVWTVRLPIAPGTYHYGFRTAAGVWFVPAGVPQVDDDFGGTSAVLVVK